MAPPAVQTPALTTEPDTPVFREARLEIPEQRSHPKEEVSVSHRLSVKEDDLRASFVPESLEANEWLESVQTTLYRQPEVERRIRQLVDLERKDGTKRRAFTLVSGKTGSGRSFCTRQILQTIARESDGCFICGKFNEIFQPVPYGAFLMCVSQYINMTCERGPEEVAKFRALIQEHVGRNVAVLRSWLPSLERVMGPPDDDSSTEEGRKDKFARSLKMLRKAMSRMGRPTFTLLENIQFADQDSLDLMVDLLRYPPRCGGFFVATCDGGVEPDSLVAVKLREIENTLGLDIVEIVTQQSSQQRLLEALEGTDLVQKEREKLAHITHQRSGGDLFLSSLFLRWVHNKRILSRDCRTGKLVVDEDEIEVSFGHKMCKELLLDELMGLPAQTRETLKVAACLGHEINAELLGYVLDQDTRQVNMVLQTAKEKGMIMQCAQINAYCFSHDVVQKAAFSLIAEADKPLFHAEIGRRIWRKKEADDLGTMFTILEQLKLGRDLIRREKERVAIAQLCLYAGERAATSSSFERALSVLEFGVFLLLDEESWRKEYELTLALCNSTIEMQSYAGRFEEMDDLIEYTIAHARSLNDKMRAYTCKVSSLSLRGKPEECIDVGTLILSLLGINMSKMTCRFHIFSELRKIKALVQGKSDQALLRLPRMTDWDSLEAMRILSLLMFPAMSTKSAIAPLTMLLLMKLTLTKVRNEIDEAYRFGQLAMKLQEQESRIEYMPRVAVSYFGFIHGWKQPVRESLAPLLKANQVGMEYGDLEFASVSVFLFCMNSIETGQPLDEISLKADALLEDLSSRRYEGLAMMASPFIQYIRRLVGADGLCCMHGLVKRAREAKMAKAECVAGLWRMRIAYIFGEFEEAGKMMEETDWSTLLTAPQYALIAVAYITVMISCSNVRIGRNVNYHKRKVKKVMRKFQQWARSCPHECSSKCALIEAEWASIHGKSDVAREKYTNAILMAKGMGNNNELATAHERAMHHYRSIKDYCAAKFHGEESHEAYLKWGAKAKATQLRVTLDSIPSTTMIVNLPEALANAQCCG